MKSILLPLPPTIEEQKRIVASVNESSESILAAIERAEREIDLIREYRTRLIADVVTGKVDVRGLAPAEAPLDDEQIDEGIDDEEMLGDDEPELVEEVEE
jgi:type I restriction enzyme S subunit